MVLVLRNSTPNVGLGTTQVPSRPVAWSRAYQHTHAHGISLIPFSPCLLWPSEKASHTLVDPTPYPAPPLIPEDLTFA